MESKKIRIEGPGIGEDKSLLALPGIMPQIHLQWFSDDAEEEGRTEQPTDHKLRKLKEDEGQVPKSQELVGAVTLLLPALLLLFLLPRMMRTFVEMLRFFFLRAAELDPTQDSIIVVVFLSYFARLILPILAVSVVAAIFSNVVQNGFFFATKPIIPQLSKAVPKFGKFFKRIFSVDGLYDFFKSIVKLLIIGGVVFTLIRGDFDRLRNMQTMDLWTGLTVIGSIASRMLMICAVLLLLFSIPDLLFQRWRFKERNKMSRKELKEEFKTHEGDPQIRNRIRSRFRELLKQNINVAVPQADVVITNPTHFAIALEYRQGVMPGPMVTAKGTDETAARIRQIATDNDVPLVENKPLAQALYKETEVGEIIPEAYYVAVATVLSKVMYINEMRRKAAEAAKMAEAAQMAGKESA